jgi:tetratricopeptide (TPR) repeat protein
VQAQRAVAGSLRKLGNVKLQAGDQAGALAAYQESLEIARKLLAAQDPGDAQAQRDVMIGNERVANALTKLNRLGEALPLDEDNLAISEGIAKRDNTDRSAQGDLAITLFRVGDDLRKLGRLDEAFVDSDRALSIRRRLADAHPEDANLRDDVETSTENMGGLAYILLVARKFQKSLDASDLAIAGEPGLAWLQTNRAHALMFLGRINEARKIYLDHRGEKTQGDKIWEVVIREDFAELRKAGLTNPLMDEIEKLFDHAK